MQLQMNKKYLLNKNRSKNKNKSKSKNRNRSIIHSFIDLLIHLILWRQPLCMIHHYTSRSSLLCLIKLLLLLLLSVIIILPIDVIKVLQQQATQLFLHMISFQLLTLHFSWYLIIQLFQLIVSKLKQLLLQLFLII